jgi:hypothetical protein
MTFEVMGTEIGALRIRDVRRALPDGRPGDDIAVLVLGPHGEPPFIGEVKLTSKRSGRGEHLALLCPACATPRAVLYSRRGSVACAGCTRRRTRQQTERTLASWKRGGREEDRLLRLIGRRRSLDEMRALVDEIVEGDVDRAHVVLDSYNAAVMAVEVRS